MVGARARTAGEWTRKVFTSILENAARARSSSRSWPWTGPGDELDIDMVSATRQFDPIGLVIVRNVDPQRSPAGWSRPGRKGTPGAAGRFQWGGI